MNHLIDKAVNKSVYKYVIFVSFLFIAICGFTSCSNIDVQTLNNKAAELMAQGDVDGAIARLESIQDLNPNFPQTNYNLGIAYEKKGNYDKAIHYLEKAISLKPDLYQAHLTLAVVSEAMTEKIIENEIKKLESENKGKDLDPDEIEFSAETKLKLVNYNKKAKIAMEEYLKHAPNVKNKNELEQRIKEYSKNIEQYKN